MVHQSILSKDDFVVINDGEMHQVTAITEENAASASTEQVSASIQEQLAATQEVENVSEQLSLSAVGLQENVEKFKL